MTYMESMPILEGLAEKYHFASSEREAMANAIYLCKKMAKEEASRPTCLYYVGDYYYKEWKNAITACRNMKQKYILEKRTDNSGHMITKKYTIANGKVLGVRTL